MAGRVQNRVCIVTGAGSGIGKASVSRLAEEGAKVVCGDINSATADTVSKYGSVDVLVNNAGVNMPSVFHEITNEIIDKTLNVNVKGAIVMLTHQCWAAWNMCTRRFHRSSPMIYR